MICFIAACVLFTPAHTVSMGFVDKKIPVQHIGSLGKGLTVRVANGTKSEVEVWSAGFYVNHRWSVVDGKGKPQAYSKVGKDHAKAFGTLERDKNVRILIKPGQSIRYQTPPFMSDFNLKPGKYKLVLTYQDMNGKANLTLKTRAIKFSVIKKS